MWTLLSQTSPLSMPGVAVAQVDAAFADRLHLGAEQRHSRFPFIEDVVVVQRLAVVRDDLLRFLALALGRHISWSAKPDITHRDTRRRRPRSS